MKPVHRPGFALLLVMAFIILFMAMLGVACRQTAAALRIATIRTKQIERDEGSLHALGKGIALLETGLPPSDPYSCGVEIETSTGLKSFTVTFLSSGGNTWTVQAELTPDGFFPEPMPTVFTPPEPEPEPDPEPEA